jgi:hypothetical protein
VDLTFASVCPRRIEAGRFCRDGPEEIGTFGCRDAAVTAIPAPRGMDASNRLRIFTNDDDGLAAYAGNVLNFNFGIH